MRERFVDEFIAKLSNNFCIQDLELIRNALVLHVNDYDVAPRQTALAVVDYVPECAKVYLVTKKLEGLADGTIQSYKMRIAQFFDTIRMPIEQIKSNDIKVYLYRLQESNNISDRTLDGIMGILSTFFRWCAADGYINVNPMANIKEIKYEKHERDYLSYMELECLRNACSTLREKAMAEVFYSTGCRAAEFLTLTKDGVDFATGKVHLFGKGKKHRTSYLNPKAEYALRKYLLSRSDQSNKLFVQDRAPFNGMSATRVKQILGALGEAANIKNHLHPHTLRHTMATHALWRGMPITDIQHILGHANINTTMQYLHINNDDVQQHHARCII